MKYSRPCTRARFEGRRSPALFSYRCVSLVFTLRTRELRADNARVNVLFLLHGVGRHAKGWSRDPVAALQAAMKLYPECFERGRSLDQYLSVVEIKYDDIFDTVLDRWAELADALPAPTGAFNWTRKVTQLLEKAGDERNLFARYGGDVLLYCGFALVARAARLRINSLLAATMAEENRAALRARRTPPKFALAAHSLGTTLAQDALYQLATGRWVSDEEQLAADPNFVAALASTPPPRELALNLHGLFLVSDTSPVLHQCGYYSELERNGVYDCHAVWSINHELDPIGIVGGAFKPSAWRPDKKNVRVGHLHTDNVHDFAHYLAHPAAHSEVFRLLIPQFSGACYQSAQNLAEAPVWNGVGGALAGWPPEERDKLRRKLRNAARFDQLPTKVSDATEKYFKAIDLL